MKTDSISIQIQNVFDENVIDDLKKAMAKRKCLNTSNVILIYTFHVVQTMGILTTTIAAGYNLKWLVWIGAGLNSLAALIHIYEQTNNSISKKGQKPWNFGKTGVYSKDMIEVYKQKAKNRQPMSKETINKMKIAQLGSKHPKAIPVLQYKLNGEFIKEYETISEAQKLIPRTSKIKNVCLGLAKTSGGFIWKFKKPKQNY